MAVLKGRPTLAGVLFDTATPWSIYAVPGSVAANVTATAQSNCRASAKFCRCWRPTGRGRTFTINLLVESTLTWTKADLSALLTYQGRLGRDTHDVLV